MSCFTERPTEELQRVRDVARQPGVVLADDKAVESRIIDEASIIEHPVNDLRHGQVVWGQQHRDAAALEGSMGGGHGTTLDSLP